jgi:hypothetical protein
MRPRVTYRSTPAVWVEVRGEARELPPHPELGPLPACPDDDGVVARLRAWLEEQDIETLPLCGGLSGGGAFRNAFRPVDAEKVLAWLREQGCEEVP